MTTPIEVQALGVLASRLSTISMADYDLLEPVHVFQRRVDRTDPNPTLGVYFHSWVPRERPNIGGLEPALGRYRYSIQAYLKESEREPGEVRCAALTKRVRTLLYRDQPLRQSLGALREDDEPPMERALRYGVEQTEYADVPFTGGFAFLSQTEFWLETEVV